MVVQASDLLHEPGPRDIRASGSGPRSFRVKLILFGLGVAFVSSFMMAALNYAFMANVAEEVSVDRLAAEVRTLSTRFADVFGDFQNDAELLAHMPPIKGIIRAGLAADGLDSVDGSTAEQWRKRLEVIFANFMLERPHYTQLRYIGLADNGRELVRVDRTAGGLKRTPPDELQAKGNEAYILRSLDLGAQEVYISEVTYNREHGEVDPSLTPTIRMVAPVLGDDRTLFGFVVVNADYPALLQRAFEALHPEHVVTMVNDRGDYLQRRPGEAEASFYFHAAADWAPPPFLDLLLDTGRDEAALKANGEIAYLVRVPIGTRGGESFLGIVAAAPEELILAEARGLLRRNLLLGAALVLMASLGAVLFGWRLTRPLRWLTRAIASQPADGRGLDLPFDGRDEISDLARAFQRLSNELIQTTEAARQSEARLGALLATAPVGIMSVDREGTILSANDMIATLFGHELNRLVGGPIAQLIPPRLHERHEALTKDFIDQSERNQCAMAGGREVVGVRRDGSEIDLEVGLSRIAMPDGSTQVVASFRDVSERRAAAEALRSYAEHLERSNAELDEAAERARQSEERYALAVHGSGAGIWTWEAASDELIWSDRLKEIIGIGRQDAVPAFSAYASRLHPEDRDRVLDARRRHLDLREPYNVECRVLRYDGRYVWIHNRGQAVWDSVGKPIRMVGSAEDITTRKESEEQLRRFAEDLQRSNTELDEFAYVASHDLKAPLRVIDNASKWLEEDLEPHLDEDSRENMQLLRGRVARMERLLDDLLDYSRIGRKTDERFLEPVRGDVLLEDVMQLLDPPAGFAIEASPALAGIEVNRMPLQQILHNLIGNAIKHHDRKDGRVEVQVEDLGDGFAFAVIDDGPGISPDFHDQVFKMFQTLKPRDQVEGSGMGLAVVKKQIESFGGTLTLQSAEGEGSAFRFTWPKVQRMRQTAEAA